MTKAGESGALAAGGAFFCAAPDGDCAVALQAAAVAITANKAMSVD